MMKKNILATVLLSGLALSAFATTSAAVETADGKSKETSKVEVELTEDKGHENGSGPFRNKLAIVHKPTVFKFAGNTTNGSLNLSNKNPQKDTQYISVNDDRRVKSNNFYLKGSWVLDGQLSTLKDSKDNTTELPGKMIFTPGELFGYDIGGLVVKNGVEDYAPAAVVANAPIAASDSDKYELQSSFVLEAGAPTATPFLTSAESTPVDPETTQTEDTIRGVATNLGNVDFSIATGDAARAGLYEGTITWTLSPGA